MPTAQRLARLFRAAIAGGCKAVVALFTVSWLFQPAPVPMSGAPAAWRRPLGPMKSYWPLQYLETIKRPGKRYFWRAVVQEDYAFWVLAASGLSPRPLVHAGALFMLLLSFWAIYELGYAENDWAAHHLEGDQGKVPEGAYTARRPPEWPPWLWALGLSVPGIVLVGHAAEADFWPDSAMQALSGWFVLLGLTRLCYLIYNHVAPLRRVFVYPLLQLCRTFGVLAVAVTNSVGLIILTAHALARSVPYIWYRLGSTAAPGRWPDMPGALLRLFIFIALWLALAVIRRDTQSLIQPQALAICLWCVYRARSELVAAARRLLRA